MRKPGLLLLSLFLALPAAAQKAPTQDQGPRSGIIREIAFAGLRRVSVQTLRERITVREGLPLDARQIERDVRALDELGWFDSVTVRVELLPVQVAALFVAQPWSFGSEPPALPPALSGGSTPLMRLTFVFEERPYLAGVDFLGSRLLSANEISEVLLSRGLDLKLATPSNRTELWRASRAIEAELADRGRPQARAQLKLIDLPSHAVRAEYLIVDGPRISAGAVDFLGNSAFSHKKLRSQMDRVAPHAWFAGLRGKDIFTPERLALDRERIERYYRNNGYPNAKLGEAQVEVFKKKVLDWLPWPRKKEEERFRISIPIDEGPVYRLEWLRMEGAGLEDLDGLPESIPRFTPGELYSEEKILRAQAELARLPELRRSDGSRHVIDLDQRFDPAAGTVRVMLRARPTDAYIVRRIEFKGHHRFSDRFYRRRVRIAEGEPFDATRLEEGMARLADSGFIRPAAPEDISLTWDHEKRTVDVHITVEEIGRQRISLIGGGSGWGSTLGIAYNLFDLFGGEELLTGSIEGGPESLITAVQLAREGLFGTRAGLGLSLYRSVIRPRLPGSGNRQHLFDARSLGASVTWNQPAGREDSFSLRYDLAHTRALTPMASANSLEDSTGSVEEKASRSAITGAWLRQGAARRLEVSGSVAGGPLGGQEQTLRASAEYVRLARDPFTHGRNAWGFRGLVSAVRPYSGSTLAMHSRLYGDGQLVRGLRTGEFTPYGVTTSTLADGTLRSSSFATGGDLVVAANSEYRVSLAPLARRAQAVVFFDAASTWSFGRLAKGDVLDASNGRWRAASGLELRWQMPAELMGAPNPLAGETVRIHYSVDVLRLGHTQLLPDGSLFRFPERRSALGWAIGSLF
jgi:outer membrane protein insertion porin family